MFAVGALLSAIAPGLGVLIVGNSILEGVGTALLIPPVYILATLWFTDTTSRAWAFGAISGMGGVGAAAGPLIGGVIATWIDWRAAFIFQALVVVIIILLSRNLSDPLPADPTRPFDLVGAVLSAVGMFFIVFGILQAGVHNALFVAFIVIGLALLLGFYAYIRRLERIGQGTAALHRPIPKPGLQPRDGHAEPAVADHDGDVVRRLRLPAGGARIQPDQDRADLHRRRRPAS